MAGDFWSGFFGAIVGAVAAIGGGWAQGWWAVKQMDRQLDHEKETRRHELLRSAYADFLSKADRVALAMTGDQIPSGAAERELRSLLAEAFSAAQIAKLVAPAETVTRIDQFIVKISQAVDDFQKRARKVVESGKLRHDFYLAARKDLDADTGKDAELVPQIITRE